MATWIQNKQVTMETLLSHSQNTHIVQNRTYLSMVNPSLNTTYTCSVEENGEQGPKFRVIAEDSPENPIVANSATGVWTAIVKSANEIRNREHSNSGISYRNVFL